MQGVVTAMGLACPALKVWVLSMLLVDLAEEGAIIGVTWTKALLIQQSQKPYAGLWEEPDRGIRSLLRVTDIQQQI